MLRFYYFAKLALSLLLLLSFTQVQSQITFPTDRAIFQRDLSNNATLTIAGYFATCQDRVEARFVPLQSNPARPAMGTATPVGGTWGTIQSTPTCNNFRGTMNVPGGWYRLEVRGIKGATITNLTSVEHVGVGEVFLVSGQSNATGGDSNPTGPGATEDAVSSINYTTDATQQSYDNLVLACPEFTHLNEQTKTAPFGNYAWCWGYFADRLIQQINVPVLIFNAGWSGSSSYDWKNTIPTNGVSTTWFGYQYPAGIPFGNMRIALNNYIAQFGIRAILWHQGESDTKIGTDRDTYRNNLREVIEACRNLSNKPNLPFVVSRASRFSFKKDGDVNDVSYTSDDVINAQNDIVGISSTGYQPSYKVANTFPGPATDGYWDATYRGDQIHFKGAGLDSLAKFWVKQLDANFFTTATPYSAIAPPNVAITQASGSTSFTAENGWSLYNWLNVGDCNQSQAATQQWSNNSGLVRLKTKDSYNNVLLSPAMMSSSSALPVTWLYFTGKATQSLSASLEWATTEEDHSAYFELERRTNYSEFEAVGKINAAGNSTHTQTYSLTDAVPDAGLYYYRIKQVDQDGTFTYGRIISLQIGEKDLIKVFPNPVVNDIQIQSERTIQSIQVYNNLGLKILDINEPTHFVKIDMSKYLPGIYVFKINGDTFKIVK